MVKKKQQRRLHQSLTEVTEGGKMLKKNLNKINPTDVYCTAQALIEIK